MRHFSDGEDDSWDPAVDFMYQAGAAMAERERDLPYVSVAGASMPKVPDISQTYPGVLKLFKAMAPRRWTSQTVNRAFGDVVLRYSQPHRGYHNLSHLEDLGVHFAFNQHLLTRPQAQAVCAALVLHDVVYGCAPGADETASSDYAGNFLRKLGAGQKLIADAQRIILATASHKAEADDFGTPVPRYGYVDSGIAARWLCPLCRRDTLGIL